ncbi:hypothetical protein BGW37DRAFT_286109 [Umbelopsis sp. PMI_123]|nr:hypothetical protein BGW37DRAFT_286109 [Umbelopsis sp. PMI_123]
MVEHLWFHPTANNVIYLATATQRSTIHVTPYVGETIHHLSVLLGGVAKKVIAFQVRSGQQNETTFHVFSNFHTHNMDALITSLEDNPNYRFIPLGPSSAAGVMTAAFFIMMVAWIYNAVRFRGFLAWSIARIILFCAILTVGYILKIVCNSILSNDGQNATNEQVTQFVNIYIAANALTAIGTFILFTGLLSITRNWVLSKRDGTNEQHTRRDSRIFRILTIITVVALVLTIVGSSNNMNVLRVASNAIFIVLVVLLLLVIRFYHYELAHGTEYRSSAETSKFSHPYAVQFVLFLSTFLLLIAQAFKLAQYAVPVTSPALKNIALIYIFGPVIDLIILIIMAISWGPVFHKSIWQRILAQRQAEGVAMENANAPGYPMTEQYSRS